MDVRCTEVCEHILTNNQPLLPVNYVSIECWEMKFFSKVGHTILKDGRNSEKQNTEFILMLPN